MTRVRAHDYEDKRNVILRKAAALIARKGFDVATMMDVAQACGTSKSHLYHYFPSKEDLLYAIVHDHITRQAADLIRIVHLPLPADERFAQFVDSFMQGASKSRDEHIMLMNDLKFLPRGQREHVVADLRLVGGVERALVAAAHLDDFADRCRGQRPPSLGRDDTAGGLSRQSAHDIR